MAFIVTGNCENCKFTDCVTTCPVNCFYQDAQNPQMIYIHPEECIDCGACPPVCPVEAIYPQEELPAGMERWIEINREHAMAPDAVNIAEKLTPLPTAEAKKKRLGY